MGLAENRKAWNELSVESSLASTTVSPQEALWPWTPWESPSRGSGMPAGDHRRRLSHVVEVGCNRGRFLGGIERLIMHAPNGPLGSIFYSISLIFAGRTSRTSMIPSGASQVSAISNPNFWYRRMAGALSDPVITVNFSCGYRGTK